MTGDGKGAEDHGQEANGAGDGLGAPRAGALAAVAGIVFNLYDRFHWYDEVIHAYNFFALTLVAAVYAYGAILTG
ncbi:MAG TPA: hypothetical protein VGR18_00040, partial [Rubrobacter sp.]|nr:hypothetical protein [Rubrobacter sp.]